MQMAFNNINGGNITINGGDITAVGNSGGAGVGGGYKNNSGTITINGGHVHAESNYSSNAIGSRTYYGPGIGPGGGYGNDTIDLTINGGTVEANGIPGRSAGIGSAGFRDIGGNVTINGGNVTAVGNWWYNDDGDKFSGCAAIGAAFGGGARDLNVNITGGTVNLTANGLAAGICGGMIYRGDFGGEGANVSITGGIVDIRTDHAAIGHGGTGYKGTLTIGDDMKVYAGNNAGYFERDGMPFTAAERVAACQYRNCARIEKCDHPGNTYESLNQYLHKHYCDYCATAFEQEAHTLDLDGKCTVCGYSAEGIVVTFNFDNGVNDPVNREYEPATRYSLPDVDFTVPEGKIFTGWKLPNGDIKQSRDTFVTGTENMTVTATWADKATIYFLAGDGKIQMTNGEGLVSGTFVEAPKDRLYTIPEYEVTWEGSGKTFLGWYKGTVIDNDIDIDTTYIWTEGEQFTPEEDLIVLKAVWGVCVTFDMGYDSEQYPVAVPVDQKIEKPEDPVREGYVFKGWYNGDTVYDFDTDVIEDITLTAMWEEITYKNGDFNKNGVLDKEDAALLLKHISGIAQLDEKQLEIADVNGDGNKDILDVIAILKIMEAEE